MDLKRYQFPAFPAFPAKVATLPLDAWIFQPSEDYQGEEDTGDENDDDDEEEDGDDDDEGNVVGDSAITIEDSDDSEGHDQIVIVLDD